MRGDADGGKRHVGDDHRAPAIGDDESIEQRGRDDRAEHQQAVGARLTELLDGQRVGDHDPRRDNTSERAEPAGGLPRHEPHGHRREGDG